MAQKNDGQDYTDPILTPGNLRKFVENLPGKAKVRSQILLLYLRFLLFNVRSIVLLLL